MDTFVHVNVIEEATDLTVCIMLVEVLWQVNCLFLDGPDESFRVAILPGFAHLGHTDLDVNISLD